MFKATAYLFAMALVATSVTASSAEFILDCLVHTATFPMEIFQPLQYNSTDSVVGLYQNCDTCYNFTGIVTNEGYYEITESTESSFKNSKYLTIDEETGLVTINDTAITAPFLVATHLFYYDGSLSYTLSERALNETYYLYFLGSDINYDVASFGTNYSASMVTAFPNGTRYYSYTPDEASTTVSYSRISHIPMTYREDATGVDSSSSSGEGVALLFTSNNAGFFAVIVTIFGWIYTYGI